MHATIYDFFMIDLQALRSLAAVERHGSVVAAADALGFSPSAVSQQIKKLERQSRAALLERQGRGVLLTERGRTLVEHGSRLLADLERVEAMLTAGDAPQGTLSVASFSTATRALFGHVARRLAQEAPQARLEVTSVDPVDAVALVAHGDADVAVVHNWNSVPLEVPAHVAVEQLCEDEADVVLPRDHRLAGRLALDRRELLDETWCATPKGAICHEALMRLFQAEGAVPRVAFTDPDFATHVALAGDGAALALVPRLGRPPLPSTVVARPVAGERPRRVISAAYRRTMAASPGVQLLVRLLHEAAAGADATGSAPGETGE
ncbi:Putative transcriptional regulator, LysR family [Sinomonas atrocyanea]|uniref:Putative transcriptional regulator, LysR family n=2 Tax=Sinomonas atrocyanea TaxID=37927 RepID=A0A126ZY59_9MICC|nr:Putative transcriptional regulator, LysR family [Sinomonas atrocyanea]GEB64423.1 LysR family transcriptional regulator [Sinomonas atrocyanea]GGG63011.1 LysR family transcriptional regulator [Sinomonas atrocyanea]